VLLAVDWFRLSILVERCCFRSVATPVSTTPVEDDRVVVSTDDRYLVVVDGLSDIEKHHRRSFSDAAAREIAKLNFNRIISALLMLPSCHTVIVSSSVDLGRNFFKAHQVSVSSFVWCHCR
jgi:hypothetical protein